MVTAATDSSSRITFREPEWLEFWFIKDFLSPTILGKSTGTATRNMPEDNKSEKPQSFFLLESLWVLKMGVTHPKWVTPIH